VGIEGTKQLWSGWISWITKLNNTSAVLADVGFVLRPCPSELGAGRNATAHAFAGGVLAWDAAASQLDMVGDATGQCGGDHGGLVVQLCSAHTIEHWLVKHVPPA
jgi:hypothetical protein